MRKINKIQIPSGESAEINDARIPDITYKKGRLLKVNDDGTGFDFTTLKTINGVPLYGFGDIRLSIDNGNVVTTVVDEVQGVDDYLCFEATVEGTSATKCCSFNMRNNGNNAPILYYSYDKINWTLWDYSTIYLQHTGDKVYFRGENGTQFSHTTSQYSQFRNNSSQYPIKISGNVMRLLGEDNNTTVGDYCFTELFCCFRGTTSNTSYFENDGLLLPATELGKACYSYMFWGCKISVAPNLPATTLTENCYENMFGYCDNLIKSPNLPATTLTKNCYKEMFLRCTSLREVGMLPFTSVAESSCQGMFYGCSNLTDVPPLLPTTLAKQCYYQMFYNCSLLQEVTTHHTDKMGTKTSDANYRSTYQWLSGVASAGQIYCPEELVLDAGVSGLPSGWTRENI